MEKLEKYYMFETHLHDPSQVYWEDLFSCAASEDMKPLTLQKLLCSEISVTATQPVGDWPNKAPLERAIGHAGIMSMQNWEGGVFAELGGIVILPQFRRQEVALNLVYDAISYSLALPMGFDGWLANCNQKGSSFLAKHHGFVFGGMKGDKTVMILKK